MKKIFDRDYIILDGAMGTEIQKRGLKLGGIPELLNITSKEMIEQIHLSYMESGSDIVYANTFGANGYKLKNSGYSVKEIIEAGIDIAKSATDKFFAKTGKKVYVALDLGPIGQLLEPTGILSFDEAYEYYKEAILAGKHADLVIFETQTDLLEVKSAVLAAKENSDLPIMVTMTFEENLRTFTGCSVEAMALTLNGLGVDAMGVNCSLGPKELLPVVNKIRKYTSIPVIAKPNAGLPDPLTNTYNVSPEDFANDMELMARAGVKVFGGCCGTTPEFIKALTDKINTLSFEEIKKDLPEINRVSAVCSPTRVVSIDEPRIIGERINPTGKKKFKEALLNNDIDYILNQATEQIEAGADILDVNVGLPGIDEKNMMITAVKAIQGIVDVPLQIDSTIPEVLEAALRIYAGKPIVNSVNGEEKSLDTVLPIVKKYGAAVVGLTLDENGIPKTSEERFNIAKKILDKAISYGIPKEDVYIDCLTLTASAEQEGVMETLKALNKVKKELGLKTVLGVSNISFGLPNRELVNQAFLTMALNNGLDLPIINPNITAMTGAFRAFKLLAGFDKNSMDFIDNYSEVTVKTVSVPNGANVNISEGNSSITADKGNVNNDNISDSNEMHNKLSIAIEKGLKSEGVNIAKELLKNDDYDPMILINNVLIPALDKTGAMFEKGKIFLPQLILSASVAQGCFEVIKDKMNKTGGQSVSKGKIILATVKGDIHDIGKNIVKVLLENYGYTVIDLGKDVEYQAVVDAAIEHNAKLVGLSALMTTTLVSMEETIKLLRENNVDCKVVVGGAVLTEDYAKKIGADFYAKDAKESVDVAKIVLGE